MLSLTNHPQAPGRAFDPLELVPEDFFGVMAPEALFDDFGEGLELDVGCGDGGFLLQMAAHYPGRRFLGIERLLGRVRKICRKARTAGLGNLKVLRIDSEYALGYLLPPGCCRRVHLLFPDPWPKKKHRRRRLIRRPFLGGVRRVLRPGGEFRLKTDHEAYFESAVEMIGQCDRFRRADRPDPAEFYPKTDFELQWEAEGRRVYQACWVVA